MDRIHLEPVMPGIIYHVPFALCISVHLSLTLETLLNLHLILLLQDYFLRVAGYFH